MNLILTQSEDCVIIDETKQDDDPNTNSPVLEIRAPTDAILKIKSTI